MRVLTAPDVVSVVAIAMGRAVEIPRVIKGVFAAEGQVPSIPFFLRSTINVAFVAKSADGQSSSVNLPIEIR